MTWWARLFRRRDLERRLDTELRFHFESRVADRMRTGLSEPEARRQTRLEFGNLEEVKEECRDARGTAFVESTAADLRYAFRTLRKSPVFTLAAIGTLALGIGANTAIFQLIDTVFLRSLPVPGPHRLATIAIHGGNLGFGLSRDPMRLTWPLFDGIRDHQQGLSGVFAWSMEKLRVGRAPDTRELPMMYASGDFFSTLQIPPVAGRLFDRSDDQPGCASPGVVLSDSFWRSEFGGQPSAVGSRIVVQDIPLPIVGVAPPGFTGLEVGNKFDFALPLCAKTFVHHGDKYYQRSDVFWLNVMGRLKPGWTRERAEQQLEAISPELFTATAPAGYSTESIERFKKLRLAASPGGTGVSWFRFEYRTSLWLLLAITGLVLLIACANLANLMLARASARRREFAVRLALGATRLRLLRQALPETILLATAGAALGFGLARILSRAIVLSLGTEQNPLHLDLTPDWRMLAFTTAVALATCLIFGLVPALRSLSSDPGETVKAGGRGLTADRKRFSFQRSLIVLQISISLVLVVGAFLLVRSFRNLITLDPGFREKGILVAAFDMSRMHIPPERIKPLVQSLIEEVRAIPQVEAAAATTNIVLNGGSWTLGVQAGAVQDGSKFTWVSPGYFNTVQTPILAGRDLTADDSENSTKVVIVNQTFARRLFPGVDPIGKTFRSGQEPGYPEAEYQIVAVCRDTRYSDLRNDPPPQSYAPITQHPSYGPWAALYVRSSFPLAALSSDIKRRIAQSRPGIGMEFRVFETEIRNGLIRERLIAALSGFFGALAVLLATIGLYSVVAYMVVSRRNEIGIRMALGASRAQVVALFMREAATLAALGVAIGLTASLLLARAATSLLFGLTPHDSPTYLSAAALLAAVAALGSYIPAHRAARQDPMTALRYE
jgi:predicted permease